MLKHSCGQFSRQTHKRTVGPLYCWSPQVQQTQQQLVSLYDTPGSLTSQCAADRCNTVTKFMVIIVDSISTFIDRFAYQVSYKITVTELIHSMQNQEPFKELEDDIKPSIKTKSITSGNLLGSITSTSNWRKTASSLPLHSLPHFHICWPCSECRRATSGAWWTSGLRICFSAPDH